MFNFIDKIILSTVLERIEEIKPMLPDIFEKPSTYKAWPFFIRYWLAMRYLKRKTETLGYFHLKNLFPIPEKEFLEQFKSLLVNSVVPRWTNLLRSIVIYPLLLICLITTAFFVKKDYDRQLLEKALSVHLIQYADLLHQRITPRLLNQKAWLEKIDSKVSIEKEKILSALPYPLLLPFEQALSMLRDDKNTGEDIFAAFTTINKFFDKYTLPYYIVPKTFYAGCFSFIGLSLELELPDANKNCQTTMLITYKLKQRDYFEYQQVALFPVYHGYRIDNVPISEAALGLTYHKGLGSLILLNSTRDYALNQILPALIYRGRHQIVPLWFKNDPRIENEVAKVYQQTLESIYQGKQFDAAKILAKALVNNQEAATRSRLRQSLMQADSGIAGDYIHSGLDALTHVLKDEKDNTPQFPGIEVLEKLIIKSVAYHEAYHQIPKGDWKEAYWVNQFIRKKDLKNSILEELGAYLVELYYGEKTRGIQITQLFFFSVNILLENRPESDASRLILATLMNEQQTPSITNNPFELLKAYKILNKMEDEELGRLAEKAYIKLFERPLPEISH